MKTFKQFKKEALKDPAIREAHRNSEWEFVILSALIEARIKKGITQKDIAESIGTRQSAISRFEAGTYHPTVSFVQKIARKLNLRLVIEKA